jgi:hypothetical protein
LETTTAEEALLTVAVKANVHHDDKGAPTLAPSSSSSNCNARNFKQKREEDNSCLLYLDAKYTTP